VGYVVLNGPTLNLSQLPYRDARDRTGETELPRERTTDPVFIQMQRQYATIAEIRPWDLASRAF
jgi:hypothetical protein